jgi:hypothetical protein
MIVPSQLALKTHTHFGCAASLATLDKLVDRFPLPPVAPPIGDTSLTHVMSLAAHLTTSPTPTAMGQSFIMTLYKIPYKRDIIHYLLYFAPFKAFLTIFKFWEFCRDWQQMSLFGRLKFQLLLTNLK